MPPRSRIERKGESVAAYLQVIVADVECVQVGVIPNEVAQLYAVWGLQVVVSYVQLFDGGDCAQGRRYSNRAVRGSESCPSTARWVYYTVFNLIGRLVRHTFTNTIIMQSILSDYRNNIFQHNSSNEASIIFCCTSFRQFMGEFCFNDRNAVITCISLKQILIWLHCLVLRYNRGQRASNSNTYRVTMARNNEAMLTNSKLASSHNYKLING